MDEFDIGESTEVTETKENEVVFEEPDKTTTVTTEVEPLPAESVTIEVPVGISSKAILEFLDGQVKDQDEKIKELKIKMQKIQDTIDILQNSRDGYITWIELLKRFE